MSPPRTANPVLRPRLLGALAGRFDRRLTIVEAGPGFGKSTLIRQAMAENSIIDDGVDVLVRCHSGIVEEVQLAGEITSQLAVAARQPAGPGSVPESIWAAAPRQVCVILDDFHRIQSDSTAFSMIEELLRDMPTNGHLLISTRPPVRLPLARLLAAGEVLALGEADLALDEQEIRDVLGPELAEQSDGRARWPALAGLMRTVGVSESETYLWEEVLRPLGEGRRRDLARLSLFEQVDQSLASALGVTDDLGEVLAPLPLIPVDETGVARFHGLWQPVLEQTLTDEERISALRQGADHLLAQGSPVAAAEAYARAGDVDRLTEIASERAGHMLSSTHLPDVIAIYRMLPDDLRSTMLGLYLRAIGTMDRSLPETTDQLERLAELANERGDFELALKSLWRSTQIHGLMRGFPAAPHLVSDTERLAAHVGDFGQSVVARHQAVSALVEGRALQAIELATAGFAGFGSAESTMFANLAIDALNPAAVLDASARLDEHTTDVDEEDLSDQGIVDFFGSQAVWFLGMIDPADVGPIAISLTRMVSNQQMRHQDLMMNSTVTSVLLAAGEVAEAERTAARAELLSAEFEGMHLRVCGHVARAAVLSNQGKVDEADGEMLRALEVAPIGNWPHRPFLTAISVLASMTSSPLATVPIDQMGLPFQVAVAAGEALRAARKGDPVPASELPWDQPWLLSAQVWPENLTELAVAALAAPSCPAEMQVRSLLASIPGVGKRLDRIARNEIQARSDVAELAAALSEEPPPLLEIQTLGRFALRVNGVAVADGSWTRRERVRELMALISHHGRLTRADLMVTLWPDAPQDKASANLRTNLRHLQNCLEPARPSREATQFLQVDNTWLDLSSDRVLIDAGRFEKLISDARSSETQGVPSAALDQYRSALELYSGDYMIEFESAEWAEFDRIRLRSLAAQASVRVAELLLARGEPEASAVAANRAVTLEALFERGHRARVRALLGQEDRAAARTAMEITLRTLAEANLTPEPDTVRLASSLGL